MTEGVAPTWGPRASQDRLWAARASQHRLWERVEGTSSEPRSILRECRDDSSEPRSTLGGDFGPSELDFRVSEGSILVPLRCFFAPVGRLTRTGCDLRFDSVWASRNEVRRLHTQVKHLRKIVLDTLLTRPARQIPCEILNLAPLGRLLGSTWDLLGSTWRQLGRSWGQLGRLRGQLQRSWGQLERSWGYLGGS